ncbi:hypothetical protein BGZ61DRAFT_499693 [Ilyonectria robusta]|uniref:uncharacterized protein n=1 Tax=Ilyonectria robusta TaxID=1079257 RepID=UPI001E8D38AD|nr:uncharacterized protein BGZ61DRAFT_499693 [Ilyonectria robusta]KAH8659679.1 hypothetical protein BGZ61DRAFT_499693 [Ilyonectria robusta]
MEAGWNSCLQTLEGHDSGMNSVVFSADGQWLASATGACLQRLNMGRVITHLSFDPMTNSRLSTDLGVLNLDLLSAIDTQPTEASSQDISHCGYGVSTDGMWIAKDWKRVIWLHPEYEPGGSVVTGSTVAIGCRSGLVLVMQFSENGPDSSGVQ